MLRNLLGKSLKLSAYRTQIHLVRCMSNKTHYQILGVNKNASAEDVRKAYLTLCKKYHPDTNSSKDAQTMFVHINNAYEVLSKPDTRAEYDESLREPKKDFFAEEEKTEEAVKRSPFLDSSQEYYSHPSCYKKGSHLRMEAERVWEYHEREAFARANFQEMSTIHPWERKKIGRFVLGMIVASGIFTYLVTPRNSGVYQRRETQYQQELNKRMQIAEEQLQKRK